MSDQEPGASMGAIAALLSRLRETRDGPAAYAPFVTRETTVPTTRLDPAPLHVDLVEDAADREAREQLDGYEHDDAPYETKLSYGHRYESTELTHDVTVLEMYWADLSRLRNSALRILGEAYQLIFHLPALGAEAIASARSDLPLDATWSRRMLRWALCFYAFAATLVTLFIPMVNLGLIVALAATFPGALPPNAFGNYRYPHASLFGLVVALAIAGLWLLVARSMRGRSVWAAGVVALVAIAGLVLAVVKWHGAFEGLMPLSFASTVLVAGGLVPVVLRHAHRTHPVWVHIYEPAARADRRRGWTRRAQAASTEHVKTTPRLMTIDGIHTRIVCYSAAIGVAIVLFAIVPTEVWPTDAKIPSRDWMTLIRAAMNGAQWCLVALLISWSVALGLTLLAVFGGVAAYLVARGRKWDPKPALWRGLATGRLALLASIALFLVATLGIGAGVEISADRTFHLTQVPYESVVGWFRPPPPQAPERAAEPPNADGALDGMLAASGTPLAWVIGIVFVLALASVAVPLLPNALAEVAPPDAGRNNPIYGVELARVGVKAAEGCLVISLIGLLVGAYMDLRPPLSLAFTNWVSAVLPELPDPTSLLTLAGTLLVGTATGLFAFRGKLSSLALGFRPAVDVALDVGNYFRQRPAGERLRAAASARFASLLRYLVSERYDAIVVVAHSQGTVIAADLLRYLHRAGLDRAYGVDRTVLFTMGCPLRQLYAARFPVRYAWADPPVAQKVGLRLWVNAFRRGDYVGRFLWNPDLVNAPADVPPFERDATVPKPGDQREMCIGDGAHTHYWDEHGAAIARELDRIVGDVKPRAGFRLRRPRFRRALYRRMGLSRSRA